MSAAFSMDRVLNTNGMTDAPTGLYNSRRFMLYLQQQLILGVAPELPALCGAGRGIRACRCGIMDSVFLRQEGIRGTINRKADEYEICVSGRKKTGADIQL